MSPPTTATTTPITTSTIATVTTHILTNIWTVLLLYTSGSQPFWVCGTLTKGNKFRGTLKHKIDNKMPLIESCFIYVSGFVNIWRHTYEISTAYRLRNIALHQACTTNGQMWPAEAFNLARTANIFSLLACVFDRRSKT